MLPTSFAFTLKKRDPCHTGNKTHEQYLNLSYYCFHILAEKFLFYFLQCLTFNVKHKSEKCE